MPKLSAHILIHVLVGAAIAGALAAVSVIGGSLPTLGLTGGGIILVTTILDMAKTWLIEQQS